MNAFDDSAIERLTESARDVAASEDLQRKVRTLERDFPAKSPSRLSYLTPRLLAGLGAAALVGLVVLIPRSADSASLFERVNSALKMVRSLHMVSYYIRDGKPVRDRELWIEGANVRVEDDEGTELDTTTHTYRLLKDQTTLVQSSRYLGQFAESVEKTGITWDDMLASDKKNAPSTRYERNRRYVEGGRRVSEYTITRPGHPNERTFADIDEESHLPIAYRMEDRDSGDWRVNYAGRFDYDQDVPKDAFLPGSIHADKIINLDTYRQEWVQKLDTPLIKAKVDGSMVKIRHLFVNDKGWVYILWTGKIGGWDCRLHLHDEQGNDYARTSFNPAVTCQWFTLPLIQVEGETLDGALFIPVENTVPTAPGRYLLEVDKFEQRGQVQVAYGTPDRRPWEAKSFGAPQGPEAQYRIRKVGSIDLGSAAISAESKPPYSLLFGWTTIDLDPKLSRSTALHLYWQSRFGGDYHTASAFMDWIPCRFLDGAPAGQYPEVMAHNLTSPPVNREAVRRDIEVLHEMHDAWMAKNTPDGSDLLEASLLSRWLGDTRAADADYAEACRLDPRVKTWGP